MWLVIPGWKEWHKTHPSVTVHRGFTWALGYDNTSLLIFQTLHTYNLECKNYPAVHKQTEVKSHWISSVSGFKEEQNHPSVREISYLKSPMKLILISRNAQL